MNPCPFCIPGDDVLADGHAMVRYDIRPVAPGHLFVLTRRHVAGFFDTTPDERAALLARYRGDAPNPRGGVRGVVPDKQSH